MPLKGDMEGSIRLAGTNWQSGALWRSGSALLLIECHGSSTSSASTDAALLSAINVVGGRNEIRVMSVARKRPAVSGGPWCSTSASSSRRPGVCRSGP